MTSTRPLCRVRRPRPRVRRARRLSGELCRNPTKTRDVSRVSRVRTEPAQGQRDPQGERVARVGGRSPVTSATRRSR